MTEQNTTPTEEPEPPGAHQIEALAKRAFEAAIEDLGHRARAIPRPVLLEILSRVVGQVAGLLLDDHEKLLEAYKRAYVTADEGPFKFKFGFKTSLEPKGARYIIKTELGWSIAEKDSTESMTRDPEQPELFDDPKAQPALEAAARMGASLKADESVTITHEGKSVTMTREIGRRAQAILRAKRAHTLQAAE